jgi:hypothetical protein
MLSDSYAECHIQALNAESRYAECSYAESHGAELISNGGELPIFGDRWHLMSQSFDLCRQI